MAIFHHSIVEEIAKKIGEEISSTIETQFKDSLMSGFGSTDNTFGVAMQGLGYTYALIKHKYFKASLKIELL